MHKTTGFKLELFFIKNRPFDVTALDRSARLSLPADRPRQIAVLTAEDVIVLKLEWYRLGDEVSAQQWRDVIQLLKARRADLGLAYTRSAAEELGVADLLERAWRELN